MTDYKAEAESIVYGGAYDTSLVEVIAAALKKQRAEGIRMAAAKVEALCTVPAWIHEVEPCGSHEFAKELRQLADGVEKP